MWASATGTLYFYDICGKQVSTKGNLYFGNRPALSAGARVVVTERLESVRVGSGAQPETVLRRFPSSATPVHVDESASTTASLSPVLLTE